MQIKLRGFIWLPVAAAFLGGAAVRAREIPTTQPAAPVDGIADDAAEHPVEVAAAPRAPVFHFEELTFDLGFDAEFHRRQVITDRQRRFRQTNEERRFEETLGMRTNGNLFGERVMKFDAAARWGVSQERFFEKRPGPDLRATPDGNVLEYDLRLDILPAGKVSGTAFASQLDDRVPRRFLPSLERHRERYGGGIFFNDRVLPMRLTWERNYDELTSGDEGLLDDEDRLEDTLKYELTWQPETNQSLRLEYEYSQHKEKYSGTGTRFDTTRNYLTVDHTLTFGDENRHRLETLLRFQDETGDLARDTYEVSPRLRLQHTKSLSTHYQFQYLSETFQRVRVDQWRGDIGLTHQFEDLLTSTFNFYGLRQDTDARGGSRSAGGFDLAEWGGNANFAFSKDNSLGRLSANVNYSHTKDRTSGSGTRGIVITEAATFRDPQPVFLAQQQIDTFSVVVTDANRTRVYAPGRDYVVLPAGTYTALHRVRTGRIADGETVYVSYSYRADDDYELTRDRLDFRVQQEFRFGLTPYYAGSIQDEDMDRSKYQIFRARNVNRHRIGATYRQRSWSLGLEYEYNDDAIDPYQALHANGDVTLINNTRHLLSANGTMSRFNFDGSYGLEQRNTTLVDLELNYRYFIAERLEAAAGAAYRWEDDSLFGRTKGIDLTGSLNYRIGLFSLLCEVEYDVLDLPDSSDNNFAVWLKLRREIPVIARRAR